jgi:hypothetical protein
MNLYLNVILSLLSLSFIVIHAFNTKNIEIRMKFKLFSLVERKSSYFNKAMDGNSNSKIEVNNVSIKHNNLVEKIIKSKESKHSNNIITASSPSTLVNLPSLQDIQKEALYTKRNVQSIDFCMKTSGYPSKIIKKSIYLNILTSLQEEKSKIQREK